MSTDFISLRDAHQILEIFGISEPSRAYQEGVTEEGFEPYDFVKVLHESELMYWYREDTSLGDFLDYLVDVLAEFDVVADCSTEASAGHATGRVTIGTKSAVVHYRVDEEDDFMADVIDNLLPVLPAEIEVRQWAGSAGEEVSGIAILTREEWEAVENCAPTFFESNWLVITEWAE